jgi:hypothetical protein
LDRFEWRKCSSPTSEASTTEGDRSYLDGFLLKCLSSSSLESYSSLRLLRRGADETACVAASGAGEDFDVFRCLPEEDSGTLKLIRAKTLALWSSSISDLVAAALGTDGCFSDLLLCLRSSSRWRSRLLSSSRRSRRRSCSESWSW